MAAASQIRAGLGLFLLGSAALAQSQPQPRPDEVPTQPRIIEDCSDRQEGEIVVCGKRDPDADYRLPPQDGPFDPWGTTESVSRERHRLLGPLVVANGTCSTVGPGGWTGCDVEVIKRAEQQGKRVGVGSGGVSLGVQVGRKRADLLKP